MEREAKAAQPLKCCPFCGDASVATVESLYGTLFRCGECGARVHFCDASTNGLTRIEMNIPKEEALRRWNRRCR